MKKAIVVLFVAAFLTAPVAMSFAQGSDTAKKTVSSADVVKGEIVSIDTAKNEIVVKDSTPAKDGTFAEKTIVVDAKDIGSLKVGEKIKATLKAGTNIAEKITKSTKKATKHKK